MAKIERRLKLFQDKELVIMDNYLVVITKKNGKPVRWAIFGKGEAAELLKNKS